MQKYNSQYIICLHNYLKKIIVLFIIAPVVFFSSAQNQVNHTSSSIDFFNDINYIVDDWLIQFQNNSPEATFSKDVFQKALIGYAHLNHKLLKNQWLTLIDFSKSANEKRLWILDLQNKTVRFHTLVSHGKNSGQEFATQFSNQPESFQSSLGFYITGHTYEGKKGLSLKLHGQENSNNNAFSRGIIMHGAAYVSDTYIQKNGRLGRSHGCPAVPEELNPTIITLLEGGSCLYIHANYAPYLSTSHLLIENQDLALDKLY